MVTAENIIQIAKERGKQPDIATVNAELAKINQAAVQTEEKSKLIYEVWDKVSPINGVPAEKLLARDDVDPDSEIYLIKDAETGQVIYFQPYEPEAQGFVRMKTKEQAKTVAQNHKAKIAKMRANARVIEQVLTKL